jgi:small-conductance mechanosensitive channel
VKAEDLLFGNSLQSLLVAAGISLGAFVMVWLVRTVVRRKLQQAHLTETGVDDFFYEIAARTKLYLLFLPIVYLGARALTLPVQVAHPLRLVVPLALIAQAALWLAGVADFWLRRYGRSRIEADPSAVMTLNAFRIALVCAVWVVAIIAAIDNLGFNVGAVLTGLGIGGIAVALALQNILADLFASLSIVIDKPFVLGDQIAVDQFTGTVEHIGLKTTRVRAVSGEELIFSNGDLLKSRIRNFRRMSQRRAVLRVLVRGTTPPEKLERIPLLLQTIVEKQAQTRFDRAHFVAPGASTHEFELVYAVLSREQRVLLDAQQAVLYELLRTFASEGIELADASPAAVK